VYNISDVKPSQKYSALVLIFLNTEIRETQSPAFAPVSNAEQRFAFKYIATLLIFGTIFHSGSYKN
jgi:hypothetical protein